MLSQPPRKPLMERSTTCLFALKLPWQGDFSVYIPAQELSFYSIKNFLTT